MLLALCLARFDQHPDRPLRVGAGRAAGGEVRVVALLQVRLCKVRLAQGKPDLALVAHHLAARAVGDGGDQFVEDQETGIIGAPLDGGREVTVAFNDDGNLAMCVYFDGNRAELFGASTARNEEWQALNAGK